MAERFIRHIVGCCLLFVLIINFSPCQKANCVLFVSGGVVGEFSAMKKKPFWHLPPFVFNNYFNNVPGENPDEGY